MKKRIATFFILLFLAGTAMTTTSCARKKGCPINENAHVKPDKKGNYGKRRGRSNLFPKNMR